MRTVKMRTKAPLVTAAACLALALAACGDSNDESADAGTSTAGGGSAQEATDTPIKVMSVAPVNSEAVNYPEFAATAKLFEEWINANGGINGHPLEVELCDDRNDPNAAAKCGRQAVSDEVAAVVGTNTINGDKLVAPLVKAGIPYMSIAPGSPLELTSDISFPTSAGLLLYVGEGVAAGSVCEKPVIVGVENIPFNKVAQGMVVKGLESQGKKPLRTVEVPAVPGDYTAKVSEGAEGSDCFVMVVGPANTIAWIQGMQQIGAKQRLIDGQLFDSGVAEKFPEATQNLIRVDNYAPNGFDGDELASYREAIEEFGQGQDTPWERSVNVWASFMTFANVAKAIEGEVDAESVLAQLRKTTDADSGGIAPPMDFTEEFTGPGTEQFPRMFGRSVTYGLVKDGKIEPTDGEFHDMTTAFFGKPDPAAAPTGVE